MTACNGIGTDRVGEEPGASENEKSHSSNVVDGPKMGNHLFDGCGAHRVSRCPN